METIDSPPSQSENVKRLDEIEFQLRQCTTQKDWESVLNADHQQLVGELWRFLLDVVCCSLWVRLRAAKLLNVCFTIHQHYLRISTHQIHWIRSIITSSCQVMDELNPKDQLQADQVFCWLQFLENLLLATHDSRVFSEIFSHNIFLQLILKMLKGLCICSTKVFAALTMIIASFYRHQVQCHYDSTNNLIEIFGNADIVKEGIEYFGGALLHVINSCGYPCASHRQNHLWNSLQLLGDILSNPKATNQIIFLNDFKVMIDILIREITDLPMEEIARARYLMVLDNAIGSQVFLTSQMYRKKDLLSLLQNILKEGTTNFSKRSCTFNTSDSITTH
jgi:hypothetical protein